jgi:hypothetical protein
VARKVFMASHDGTQRSASMGSRNSFKASSLPGGLIGS